MHPYRGSALLLYKREYDKIYILLERRSHSTSFRDQWTIPGGGSERQDKSALDTALREASEEIDGGRKWMMRAYKNKAMHLITTCIPFVYRYTYFMAEATARDAAPNRRWIPQRGEVSQETGSVAWFDIQHLPRKLHFTICPLLWIARRRFYNDAKYYRNRK